MRSWGAIRLYCSVFGTLHGSKALHEIGDLMDVVKMLADLRQEREQIEEAIITLERLARGRSKRRGRPPAWMAAIKRRGRPPGSKNKVRESAAA
jgi:hypothetical protein